MSSGAPGMAESRTARPGASGYEAGACRAGCRASGRESRCGTSDALPSSRAERRRSRLPRRPPSATAGRLQPRSAGNRHHRPSAAIRSVAVSRRSSDFLMVRVGASQLHPRPPVRWPPRPYTLTGTKFPPPPQTLPRFFSWGDTSQAAYCLALACCFYLNVKWVMDRFFKEELERVLRGDLRLVYGNAQLEEAYQ